MINNVQKKQLAIICDNLVVFDALNDNSEYSIQLLNAIDAVNFPSKIDLLLIDQVINSNIMPLYRVNNIVNLTDTRLSQDEITLHKPFKLEKLLKIISNCLDKDYIFCCINQNWIYNQRLAKISSPDLEISLTNKENDLFVEILKSENFSTNKDSLKTKIWNYHHDTTSTTVDTHLYKLKNKLPDGWLELNALKCSLKIDSLE
ncbi:MAG: helix-turn-helix domain-containing protein [Rickettsiaceae bacterium]|nr:helix-turn-helix domain-containing protein [Rickettsiaceae bacterium]